LKQFAADGVGNIFATDLVLSALMVCTRSVYSWDIIATKQGDQLWLDKRDGSSVDNWSVNETSHEQTPLEQHESINFT